jgi:pyridoxal phosphate enzyme (YggS family)
MIGHIQHRKAQDAISNFQMIHSVDSLRLAQRINRLVDSSQRVPVLLECNMSGEAAKYGFPLANWQEENNRFPEFLGIVKQVVDLPKLDVLGLMTMAPIVSDPEQARPIFAGLRTVRDMLSQELPEVDWRHLSMGMTDDFEVAVEEGATLVRVGRAIFGERYCTVGN